MNNPKILFIDDEEHVLNGYKRILKSYESKWDMIFTTDPDQVLKIAEEKSIDVLIVDIKMPKINGIELLTKLKTRDIIHPQILVVSGINDTDLRIEAFNLGILDFLIKPVDRIELITRINNGLTIRQYQNELINKNMVLEEELSNSQRMELMGYVAAGAVHDFKNILSSMNILTEMIQMETFENKEINQLLDKMFMGISNASELVKQMLIFKRIEKGDLIEEVDLIKTLEDCINISFPNSKIRGNVSFIHNEDRMFVTINKVHVFQLFANLLVNANEAISEKDKVVIKVQREYGEGQYIKTIIQDDGIGMDKKMVERLFDPHVSGKETDSNYGLGMYVVKWIIDKYKGFINVDSKPGAGTTFEVQLPCSK